MEQNRVYQIASVCGAGYATSGWIAVKLREALQEKNIEAEITEVKVVDLALVAANFDLIVSASMLSDIYNVPVVASSSIITGIGFEETLETIIKKLEEVSDKK